MKILSNTLLNMSSYQLYSSSIVLTNGDFGSVFGDSLSVVVVWDWVVGLSSTGRVRLTPDIIQRIDLLKQSNINIDLLTKNIFRTWYSVMYVNDRMYIHK